MNLVIIDYGSGNLRSASKALERVKSSGSTVCVTKDPDVVASADYLILPGVGAFPDCKKGITALPGMIDAIAENVVSKGRPFMGICVGMQLMSALGMNMRQQVVLVGARRGNKNRNRTKTSSYGLE